MARFSNTASKDTSNETAIATLKSVSPYSQSKHYNTEKLAKVPKVTRPALGVTATTLDGEVFIPP